MYLYNLALQQASGISQAIVGSFSAPKMQEVVVSKGTILQLLSVDVNNGKLSTLLSTEV